MLASVADVASGSVYTGADCERLCSDWNMKHTFAPGGRPTGNAVAERVIQTLKIELIWTRDWETIDELREAVAAWRKFYNNHRPHESLNWLTPAEFRKKTNHTTTSLKAFLYRDPGAFTLPIAHATSPPPSRKLREAGSRPTARRDFRRVDIENGQISCGQIALRRPCIEKPPKRKTLRTSTPLRSARDERR
jgi:hypothetical protein